LSARRGIERKEDLQMSDEKKIDEETVATDDDVEAHRWKTASAEAAQEDDDVEAHMLKTRNKI
jgi:hypothetical protein